MEQKHSPLSPSFQSTIEKCQFHRWHHYCSKLTFKSQIISLQPQVVSYILNDGIFQPEQDPELSSSPSFLSLAKALRASIDCVIKESENGIFIKTNWSSAADAEWACANLQCINSDEVFALLKASEKVNKDLACPYQEEGEEGQQLWVPEEAYLVCQRWHKLNRAMEFRCFVKDRVLIAISQRDLSTYYPFLQPTQSPDLQLSIKSQISDFFSSKLKPALDTFMTSYIFDIYIDIPPNQKVWLIDINPWLLGHTDPLLFEWEELNAEKELELRTINDEEAVKWTSKLHVKDFEDAGKLQEFIEELAKKS